MRNEVIGVALIIAALVALGILMERRSPAGLNRRGEAQLKAGNFAEAEKDFSDAAHHRPQIAEYWNNLSAAYSAEGRLDDALACCAEAIALKPDFAEAYSNRAGIYLRAGRLDMAVRDCDQAIRLKPDDAAAYVSRGNAHVAAGRFVEAVSDYTRAIVLKPDSAAVWASRARVFYLAKRYAEARMDLDRFKALGGKPDADFVKLLNEAGNKDKLPTSNIEGPTSK